LLSVDIYGYESENSEGLFIENIKGNNIYPLTHITYPFIEFRLHFDNHQTQLHGITILHSPTPDLAIIPSKTLIQDSIFLRGDTAFINIAIKNLSLHSDMNNVMTKHIISNSRRFLFQRIVNIYLLFQ